MKKRKRKSDLPRRYIMVGIVLFTALVVFALLLWSVSQAKYQPVEMECGTFTVTEGMQNPLVCNTPMLPPAP